MSRCHVGCQRSQGQVNQAQRSQGWLVKLQWNQPTLSSELVEGIYDAHLPSKCYANFCHVGKECADNIDLQTLCCICLLIVWMVQGAILVSTGKQMHGEV